MKKLTQAATRALNQRVRVCLTQFARQSLQDTDEIGCVAREFCCERVSAVKLIRGARK